MKQPSGLTPLQKSFSLLMACLVLVLTLFFSHAGQASSPELDKEQHTVSNASFGKAPELSTAPEPLAKISTLFFSLSKLWSWVLNMLAPKTLVLKGVHEQFFIQKINFIFVSTLAP